MAPSRSIHLKFVQALVPILRESCLRCASPLPLTRALSSCFNLSRRFCESEGCSKHVPSDLCFVSVRFSPKGLPRVVLVPAHAMHCYGMGRHGTGSSSSIHVPTVAPITANNSTAPTVAGAESLTAFLSQSRRLVGMAWRGAPCAGPAAVSAPHRSRSVAAAAGARGSPCGAAAPAASRTARRSEMCSPAGVFEMGNSTELAQLRWRRRRQARQSQQQRFTRFPRRWRTAARLGIRVCAGGESVGSLDLSCRQNVNQVYQEDKGGNQHR